MAARKSGHVCRISIHALLAESDITDQRQIDQKSNFYPRSPCGERRCLRCCAISCITISIHALLAESDNPASITPTASRNFYPRSPCGERQPFFVRHILGVCISIHALLAESDFITITTICTASKFLSTLSLRRATPATSGNDKNNVFLSTLSLRRATCYSLRYSASCWHFYPRSPCGERQST